MDPRGGDANPRDDPPRHTLMKGQPLKLFSVSHLHPAKADVGSERCCPTLDLSATVVGGTHVMIHRKEAEHVVHYSTTGLKISALKWKADGSALAIAWGDFTIQLLGLDKKGSHHIKLTEEGGEGQITHVGWVKCAIGPQKKLTDEEWLTTLYRGSVDSSPKRHLHALVPDLPHQVSFFEIDPSIPKLSPLPVSGGNGEHHLFSTPANIDFVFPSLNQHDPDTVDILVAGSKGGMLHIHMYDTFEIGVFDLSRLKKDYREGEGGVGELQLRGHAAHPEITTHSLLVAEEGAEPEEMWHVPMDMTNLVKSSIPLTLLANKVVTLRNLVRYTQQAVLHVQREFNSAIDLPKRLLRGVHEDLQTIEGGPSDILNALFHLVLTGNPHPVVKEWLVETLAERGHKRWDKAVTAGLEKVRDLTQQNLIPALDRMHITLSRLLGLASFHFFNGQADIGFTPSQIELLLEYNKCLTHVASLINIRAVTELNYFKAFSAWLRAEIDRLATSNPSDELSDKEALRDNTMVATYIRQHLLSSKLLPILSVEKVPEGEWAAEWQKFESCSSPFGELFNNIKNQEAGKKYAEAYPQAQFLLTGLREKTRILLAGIAESQQRAVHLGALSPMSIGTRISKWDTRVSIPRRPANKAAKKDHPDSISTTAMISLSQESSLVYLFRTSLKIENGISKVLAHESSAFQLPTGTRVKDVKFIDDNILGVLWHTHTDQVTFLAVPLSRADFPAWQPFERTTQITCTPVTIDSIKAAMCWSQLPLHGGFLPVSMEIVPPSSVANKILGRVCLMDRNGAVYKVFELPALKDLVCDGAQL